MILPPLVLFTEKERMVELKDSSRKGLEGQRVNLHNFSKK